VGQKKNKWAQWFLMRVSRLEGRRARPFNEPNEPRGRILWPTTPGADKEVETPVGDPTLESLLHTSLTSVTQPRSKVDDQKTHILAGGDWAWMDAVHKAGWKIHVGGMCPQSCWTQGGSLKTVGRGHLVYHPQYPVSTAAGVTRCAPAWRARTCS